MPRFILVLFAILAGPALAWHDTGHKATAAIAFGQLTRQRQLEIYAILRSHPRYEEDFRSQMPDEVLNGLDTEQALWMFEQASIWPDIVRNGTDDVRAGFHRSTWHYINLPVWMNEADRDRLDGKLGHNMSRTFQPPLRQNLNAVQALRGNLAVWRDDDVSDADRAVALCWILHITGDLHQPLHTVALFSRPWFPEGDRGGNSIEVEWTPENSNLHAVWDGLPTGMDDLRPTDRTLRSIGEDVVDDAAIDAWVEHHAKLAGRFVYTDAVRAQLANRLSAHQSPLVTLDHDYLDAARAIARRQVNLAGHRIAALIE